MSYRFAGTPEQLMGDILGDLEHAAEDRPDADAFLRRAMASLVGVHQLEAEHGPADPDAIREFRRRSAEAIAALGGRVTNYVLSTRFDAEAAEEGDWDRLSLQRSAIQCLLDDYAGTPVARLAAEGDVPALDAELRRVAREQEPLPERLIPRGVPGSHWWWRLPGRPDGR